MTARITGLHHIKIFVTDLARSRTWYEKVFDLRHVASFEDEDGVIRGASYSIPGTDVALALREDPRWVYAGADPFAFSATRSALDEWAAHLDTLGVEHSPIIEASAGHLIGLTDPDGLQIRLYAFDHDVMLAKLGPDKIIRTGPIPSDPRSWAQS